METQRRDWLSTSHRPPVQGPEPVLTRSVARFPGVFRLRAILKPSCHNIPLAESRNGASLPGSPKKGVFFCLKPHHVSPQREAGSVAPLNWGVPLGGLWDRKEGETLRRRLLPAAVGGSSCLCRAREPLIESECGKGFSRHCPVPAAE